MLSKSEFQRAALEVDLAPDAHELPVHVEKRGERSVIVHFLVGTALGVAMYVVFKLLMPLPLRHEVLSAASTAFGLLVILDLRLKREVWDFTATEVRHRGRGLLGRRNWVEPLAAYAGVARRKAPVRGASETMYQLLLKPKSGSRRTVLLYCRLDRAGLRRKHRHYARLFGLPALVETPHGVEVRQAEDLTRSIAERAEAGTLTVGFDPSVPPPGRGLAVEVCDERLVLRTRPGVAVGLVGPAVPGAMCATAIAAFVLHAVALPPGAPAYLVVLGICLILAALPAFRFLRGIWEELWISPTEVRGLWRLPLAGRMRQKSVPAGEVERIVSGSRAGTLGRRRVRVVADTGSVRFGYGLSDAEREWVRECILAVLSEGRVAEAGRSDGAAVP